MSDLNAVQETVDKLGRAFEEFKQKQDSVVAEEIKKGTADVVRKEEIERINKDLGDLQSIKDTLEAEIVAIKTAGGSVKSEQEKAQDDHSKAFYSFIRKGKEDGLEDLERKALNVTTSADGGFAVPEQLDRNILDLIKRVSAVRGVANTITIGGADYKKLVNVRGTASGWVAEVSTRPETNTPQLAEVTPFMGEIYANPAATQRMLDDAFFNVESWLSDEISTEFAYQEGDAFINGNGTNKPKGFLAYTINVSTDGARTFGHLEMVKTAVAGGFKSTTTSTNPADSFIDTVHAMKPELRQGAVWMMNTLTLAAVRKFRDVDGNYIWRPGLAEGQPATILSYGISEAPDMPDVATNTYPIAFGNFRRGYTIVDRMGTRMLRDPYTNKPYVHFYTTKRVGGMVVDSEAIKILATRT